MNHSTSLLLGLCALATVAFLAIFDYPDGSGDGRGISPQELPAAQAENAKHSPGASDALLRTPVSTEPLPATLPPSPSLTRDELSEPARDSVGSCNYGALPWDEFDAEYLVALRVPAHVWEDKYSGYEMEDMGAARGRIHVRWTSQAEANWEERKLAGKRTRWEKRYSTNEFGVQKPVPFKLTASGDFPYHQVMAHPAKDGQPAYIEFDWLPPDEYPDFYMLASELMWLNKKVGS